MHASARHSFSTAANACQPSGCRREVLRLVLATELIRRPKRSRPRRPPSAPPWCRCRGRSGKRSSKKSEAATCTALFGQMYLILFHLRPKVQSHPSTHRTRTSGSPSEPKAPHMRRERRGMCGADAPYAAGSAEQKPGRSVRSISPTRISFPAQHTTISNIK